MKRTARIMPIRRSDDLRNLVFRTTARIMPIRRSDDLRTPSFRTSRQVGVQHPDFPNKSSSRNAGCIKEIVLSAVVAIIMYALADLNLFHRGIMVQLS